MLARFVALIALAAVSALALPVAAQPYPGRAVKLIVAFAPGTTSDIIGRMLAEKLTQAMGQPFVVENRTGAGGTIGAEMVAKSAPDGYTLLLSTAALPVSAHVFANLKYDTARDFASVTVISHSPLLLAANLDFPPRNVPELARISARLCRFLRDEVVEQLGIKNAKLSELKDDWKALLFPDADAKCADAAGVEEAVLACFERPGRCHAIDAAAQPLDLHVDGVLGAGA